MTAVDDPLRSTLQAMLGALLSIAAGAQNPGDPFAGPRQEMVEQLVRNRGVTQESLLLAMGTVPRHQFVPEELRPDAYSARSLPIGHGEFLGHPYLSARMIELLELDGGEKVLEIGTGSGYDAALLSRVAREVFTIEIAELLADRARAKLRSLGFKNVHVRTGDGYLGWPEEAPFDAILLTAAAPSVPEALLDQLRVGGYMVVPVGRFSQDLMLITKLPDGSAKRAIMPIRVGALREGDPE